MGTKEINRKIVFFCTREQTAIQGIKEYSQYERGMGRQAHFISLDNSSLYERGIGQQTHFISFVALRVTAVGRNP